MKIVGNPLGRLWAAGWIKGCKGTVLKYTNPLWLIHKESVQIPKMKINIHFIFFKLKIILQFDISISYTNKMNWMILLSFFIITNSPISFVRFLLLSCGKIFFLKRKLYFLFSINIWNILIKNVIFYFGLVFFFFFLTEHRVFDLLANLIRICSNFRICFSTTFRLCTTMSSF